MQSQLAILRTFTELTYSFSMLPSNPPSKNERFSDISKGDQRRTLGINVLI